MSENYIFGYGSLIESESRERTTPSARYAWPVEAKGYQRGWFARGAKSGLTTTYLGAVKDNGLVINGVTYRVSEEELAATDQRESAGYERMEIPASAITMLDGRSKAPDGKFWIYLNKFDDRDPLEANLPSKAFPMVQSYVDICINGCLEIEGFYPSAENFTQRFIELTTKWSQFWVNDRLYPRRPFIFRPTASKIDDCLLAAPQTAELYYQVEIEPASWEQKTPVRPSDKVAARRGRELEAMSDLLCCWECGG